jgi:hypothetical protein
MLWAVEPRSPGGPVGVRGMVVGQDNSAISQTPSKGNGVRRAVLKLSDGLGSDERSRRSLTPLCSGTTTEEENQLSPRIQQSETNVIDKRAKPLGALLGVSAVAVAVVMTTIGSGASAPATAVAGGSGDSATGTSFVQPTVKAMSINPTDMSMGPTMTAAVPPTALATALATPTFKAAPEPGCVNNGQCP